MVTTIPATSTIRLSTNRIVKTHGVSNSPPTTRREVEESQQHVHNTTKFARGMNGSSEIIERTSHEQLVKRMKKRKVVKGVKSEDMRE